MLGPIIQALWKQVGPTTLQAIQLAVPYAKKIPPHVYFIAARAASDSVSEWYDLLDREKREKLDAALGWVCKDLAGDAASAMTGLPVAPLVKKVLDLAWEYKEDIPEAREYVTNELTRRLNPG